jgi:hypothetical protein
MTRNQQAALDDGQEIKKEDSGEDYDGQMVSHYDEDAVALTTFKSKMGTANT